MDLKIIQWPKHSSNEAFNSLKEQQMVQMIKKIVRKRTKKSSNEQITIKFKLNQKISFKWKRF